MPVFPGALPGRATAVAEFCGFPHPVQLVLEDDVAVTMKGWRTVGVVLAENVPCVPRKLRWHSFQNSHRPSLNSASLEINRQSSAQLNLLQKCSLLRLTAIMEKYSVPHKQAWTW